MPYPIAAVSDNLVYLDSAGHLRPAICATNATQPAAVVTLLVLDASQTTLGYMINAAPFDPTATQLDSWSWPQGSLPQAVTVSNFPATQPVSFAGGVTVAGAVDVSNFPASQQVTGTFWPASQPVSGAVSVSNFPATQPVSGAVTVSNLPATQPVSGTVSVGNLPAVQPVSGSIAVSNFPAQQAVTGTFFQATQPVSGSLAVTNFPATQPVSGTFFQATQPVSAASLPLPSGASTEATLALIKAKTDNLDVALSTRTKPADTQTVSGTVSVSNFPATQPVSGIVAISNFPATQPISGTVTANIGTSDGLAQDATLTSGTQKTKLVDAGGTNVASISATGALKTDGSAATQPVSGAVAVSNFPATQPISGTVSVANPARVIRTFAAAFTAATTEAMITLTPSTDGTPGSAGTSFTVTSGKKLRLTALMLSCFNATAAIHACQVNLRMTATGAATTSAPVVATIAATTAAATANLSASQGQAWPDGLELSGTMQLGISQIGVALAGQTVVLQGYEY